MKIIGNYSRLGKNENNETEITFTIRDNYKHLLKELNKKELYAISVSKAQDKRTEQQNKYMWAIIGEIDKVRNGGRPSDDFDIYIEALQRSGAKFEHLLVPMGAENLLIDNFRAVKLVRKIQMNGKVFCDFKCFYGSSKMDKKEMRDLIDTVLDMASEEGLNIVYWKELLGLD